VYVYSTSGPSRAISAARADCRRGDVLSWKELAADEAERRQGQRGEEGADGERHHGQPMPQGPADDALIAQRLAIEPGVETGDGSPEQAALSRLDLRVVPDRREHGVERK
jgi:hypothetical protein